MLLLLLSNRCHGKEEKKRRVLQITQLMIYHSQNSGQYGTIMRSVDQKSQDDISLSWMRKFCSLFVVSFFVVVIVEMRFFSLFETRQRREKVLSESFRYNNKKRGRNFNLIGILQCLRFIVSRLNNK